MKTLLRSTFIAAPGDLPDQLLTNFHILNDCSFSFTVDQDVAIWNVIRDFTLSHGHAPRIETLEQHFNHTKEFACADRLNEIKILEALIRGDFLRRLETLDEDKRSKETRDLLQEANEILQTGKEIQYGREKIILRGPLDAIRHVLDKSHDLVAPLRGAKLSGDAATAGAFLLERYELVKNDPRKGIGQHSGYQYDDLGGAKRQELWIHAGFTGAGKSTFALNWAYNQAVYYNYSSLFFSLEMHFTQCIMMLYSMHSMHEKFRDIRMQLGLQTNPNNTTGLPYECLEDGKLHEFHPNAEIFFRDFVVPDWESMLGQGYGTVHIEVSDPDKFDFSPADVKAKAELIYSKTPFDMIFVDHLGLMDPTDSRLRDKGTTERLNSVIKDIKHLARSFRRGEGIAVVGLFQISREGYKQAVKVKERTGIALYDLTALSYANECLVGNTLIPTQKGLVPLAHVKVKDKVWSSTGWKKVAHVFDQGVQPLWHLLLGSGAELFGTAGHRVRVLENEQIQWKRLEDLHKGDFVLSSVGGFPRRNVKLPPLKIGFAEKGSDRAGRAIQVPSRITPKLAYLLGTWDGDGSLHPMGVRWTGNRKEQHLRDTICQCFQEVFNQLLQVQESPSRNGSFDLTKWSKPLKRWFEKVAGPRGTAVPEAVLGSSEEVVCAYLKGLFDTDGWINTLGVVGVHLKQGSTFFISQIQMLFSMLGIHTAIQHASTTLKVNGKTYYGVTLIITDRQSKRIFREKIGFTEPAKKTRLEKAITPVKRRETQEIFPVVSAYLRAYNTVHPRDTAWSDVVPPSFYKTRRTVANRGYVPRGNIELLLKLASHRGVDAPDLQFLRALLSFHIETVKTIAPTGASEQVYDLEVGGDHEYQTGSILSHNCERSADIVTATWADPDLEKQNRMQMMCLKARSRKKVEPFLVRVEGSTRRMFRCDDLLTPHVTSPQGQFSPQKGPSGKPRIAKPKGPDIDVDGVIDLINS